MHENLRRNKATHWEAERRVEAIKNLGDLIVDFGWRAKDGNFGGCEVKRLSLRAIFFQLFLLSVFFLHRWRECDREMFVWEIYKARKKK
jgi:hypothetical protein